MSDNSEGNVIICKICGRENPPDSKFCKDCGGKLDIAIPAETTVNTQPGPVVAEEVTATPWQNDNSNPYYSTANTNYGTNNTNYGTAGSQPYYTQSNQEPDNSNLKGLAIASMVCGIISIPCCYLTIPTAIAALITGILSLAKKQGGKGMAIAGIATASVGILFWALMIFLIGIGSIADTFTISDW